ncbi:hypothetical protein TWF694_009125 [Orbilia ellipsospora]|uniref:Ankyrin n=1 Tax=Orbilia ellipsospora TaxID=2528407 RepID=A0AAV9XFG7_9PEZI
MSYDRDLIDIRTRLKRAILTDDLLVVKRLCAENPKCINYCDPEEKGNTPLHIAAELGLYGIVVFLCSAAGHEDHGISRNYEGQTPLMVASGSGGSAADDVVFYLAGEFPGSVNARDKGGMTALMMAAKIGNDANINILLDSDADINAFDPLGNTSLHYASAYGHLKAIRTLIDRGASFDHRNRDGWYAKDYSFSKAAEQYFKTLIDGVAINNMGSIGAATTTGAALHGSPKTAPSSRDGSGKRPGTAGSFSYGAASSSTSTTTLVPGMGLSGSGVTTTISAGGGGSIFSGSTISFVNSSGPGTPEGELPAPHHPPTRMLKSAASMVEFSRMDRGSMSGRPGTPVGSGIPSDNTSSPAAPGTGGGRHSAAGSVSSYASVGSMGSSQGLGLPIVFQGQQSQTPQVGTPQRSFYDPFHKLRPRASSNS